MLLGVVVYCFVIFVMVSLMFVVFRFYCFVALVLRSRATPPPTPGSYDIMTTMLSWFKCYVCAVYVIANMLSYYIRLYYDNV